MSGSERHVSGGRNGLNDGRPRVYHDETRTIGGRWSGAVTRSGDTLQIAGDLLLTCRLERVGRDGSETETVRAFVCAASADKPLKVGTFQHPLPRLAFGRGDGFAERVFTHRYGGAPDDAPLKVALASR
jgi:hypothetical protein